MALTNQQVQAAYLAIIGRPAEGSAVTWASSSFADVASLVSSIIDIRKGEDFSNNKETFVENLYQNILGRASDAEGKEYWLKALNDGASYAQVAQEFINAVLGQSQTADLYTLQNRLSIAEKISAQINTFQGGAAAEATLKALMKDVNLNTTIDSIQDSVAAFKGQNADIATVTVTPGAEEPAEGSDEHATVFKASITLGGDTINIKGSSSFADTLNLSVKGVKDEQTNLASIGTVSSIKTLNITTDTNVKTSNLDSSKVGGATSVTFKGSSNDTFTADSKMTLLDTGNGDNNIILNAKVATVKAGNGDDKLTVSGASISIANAKINLGAGNDELYVRAANIAGANIDLGAGNDIINIASIKNPAYLKGTTIDGGAGRDTMLVIGDTRPFGPDEVGLTLKNIEVIRVKGQDNPGGKDNSSKLLVSAVNGEKLTLTKHSPNNGTLEIIATKTDTKIDLSGLNNNAEPDETPLTALTLSNVGSGATTGVTVKLNKDDGITETIKLAADAGGNNKVTIEGIGTGDILNLSGISGLSGLSDIESTALTSNGSATVADNTIYFMAATEAIDTTSKAADLLSGAVSSFASGANALIAFNNGGKSYLFKATGDATTTDISKDELTLIAIVDNEIKGGDTVAPNGAITFA